MRKKIIKEEIMVVTGKSKTSQISKPNPIQNLLCPICGELNSVNRANIRLKCTCGTNLLSVKVRKKKRKNIG